MTVACAIHLDQHLVLFTFVASARLLHYKALFFLSVLYLLEGSHQVQPTLKRREFKFH